ncbi:Kin of IRRE-like protein 3 [Melipona quadrifasciata]|uniref:Kin of IRRE-like protein 3 n=1 Tax=Melipona quadrifasciata TaxID=166423 RepID=A0A0M9A7M1_9HYME|nr:Kin of IRRE-like protein 3 [Melipona quadrifasciata]
MEVLTLLSWRNDIGKTAIATRFDPFKQSSTGSSDAWTHTWIAHDRMTGKVWIGRGWWVARQLEHLIPGWSRFEMRLTSGHVFLTSLLILLRARRADAATEDSPEFSNKGTLTFISQTDRVPKGELKERETRDTAVGQDSNTFHKRDKRQEIAWYRATRLQPAAIVRLLDETPTNVLSSAIESLGICMIESSTIERQTSSPNHKCLIAHAPLLILSIVDYRNLVAFSADNCEIKKVGRTAIGMMGVLTELPLTTASAYGIYRRISHPCSPRSGSTHALTAPVRLVWAIEGKDAELPCDITPPTPTDSVNMVLWFKDTAGIPLYRFRVFKSLENSDCLGRFESLDHGVMVNFVWTREARTLPPPFTGRSATTSARGPTFRSAMAIERSSKLPRSPSRTKESSDAGPKPTVVWWKDGKILDAVVDTLSIGSPSKFTVNRLFINEVTRSLWGTKLECRAQSEQMSAPIIREVPLDVYLKPAIVKIVLMENRIYAGRPIAARCETWGSSPAARIIWKLGGQVIGDPNVSTTQRSNSTISKLALVLGKDDNGKKLTCRAENPRFPGGVFEQSEILDVAYAPIVSIDLATGYVLDTLREGDDLKLVCDVESNPPPTRIIWYHGVQGFSFAHLHA